jgi:hypothetical protein
LPFNGTGMFVRVRNWVADATAGIRIRADYHDTEDDGFADGLSHCIARDGQTTILNNIPMNSKRITSLADPIDPQDTATKAYADTKLPLAGGTITGNLTINGGLTTAGGISAIGYKTRAGLSGAYGGNWFNFLWNGNLQVWIDDYNFGNLATQSYVETRAEAWAAQYAAPKVNRAGDTMTGLLATAASGNLGSGGGMNSLMVYGSAGDWAAMTFHSPGTFAGNFGMHPSGDFYCGGFSYGAGVAYKFWTTRNLNPVQDGRLSLAGNVVGNITGMIEPFTGAVVTGVNSPATAGYPLNGARWRYMQLLTPGGWYTVGYV